MDCKCAFRVHTQYKKVLRRIQGGLMSYPEAALILDCKPKELEYHVRRHEAHINAKILEKIIVVIKSDLLENYDMLMRTMRVIERGTEINMINAKIKLSQEIRALKKDINEFISEHSVQLAQDHQNLETQWSRMQEFLLYDACKPCQKALKVVLKEDND